MKTKQEKIEDIKQTILEESIKTDPDINFMSELILLLEDFEIDYERWLEDFEIDYERWFDYLSGRNNTETK